MIGIDVAPVGRHLAAAIMLGRAFARPWCGPMGGGMSDALIAAITAILAAVVAASLSYAHARRLARRQARLDRLNAQLEELYGPLYATLEASRIAYRRLLDRLRPGQASLFDSSAPPPTDEELRQFRQWVEVVSHPRATDAYELIISKAHLLVEDEMPDCLLQFLAHKAGYDVLTQRWKEGDLSEHLSVVRHPGDALYDYLRQTFLRLKKTQARELEAAQGRR
jgi:hypothetical protein